MYPNYVGSYQLVSDSVDPHQRFHQQHYQQQQYVQNDGSELPEAFRSWTTNQEKFNTIVQSEINRLSSAISTMNSKFDNFFTLYKEANTTKSSLNQPITIDPDPPDQPKQNTQPPPPFSPPIQLPTKQQQISYLPTAMKTTPSTKPVVKPMAKISAKPKAKAAAAKTKKAAPKPKAKAPAAKVAKMTVDMMVFDVMLERSVKKVFEKFMFIFDPGGGTIDVEHIFKIWSTIGSVFHNKVWKVNIPRTHLAHEKSDPNGMVDAREEIQFPGGGTHFHYGADKYIGLNRAIVPLDESYMPNSYRLPGTVIAEVIVEGCEGVFHTTSPFYHAVTDSEVELIEPAVKGTLNVLGSCKKTTSVKRVIVTSSMAAVAYSGKPRTPDVVVDETWVSSPHLCKDTRSWYVLSKTLAEAAAWKYAKENGMDMVAINPAMVIGPLFQPTLNTSSAAILNLINGASTYPNATFGWINVQDIVKARILAFEVLSARYCLVGSVAHYSEHVKNRKELYLSLPLPEKCADDQPFPNSPVSTLALESHFNLEDKVAFQAGWSC